MWLRNHFVTAVAALPGGKAQATLPAFKAARLQDSPMAGLTACFAIAIAALALGQVYWLQARGLSALTLAILVGVLLGNSILRTMATDSRVAQGVEFSKQKLLRLGIILYGVRLSFHDIAQVGWAGVAVDALVLCSTFAIALLVGMKVLKLDRTTVLLVGAGSSICGAAAILASAPVVRATAERVVVAVSTVVVFGSLAIFIYPPLFRANWLEPHGGMSALQFGVYAGSTIHEVAQVVAAAGSIDPQVADVAVIAKMIRVMMLAPFLLLVSIFEGRSQRHGPSKQFGLAGGASLNVPWFALTFIAVVALNSVAPLPVALKSFLQTVDNVALAMAMAALGLTTHFSALRKAGFRPLLLGAILFAWLMTGGALINHILMGN